MSDLRPSVKATYSSAEGGPPYSVTATVNDIPVCLRASVPDPFVRQTIRLHWWDALRMLVRGRGLTVVVVVSAPVEIMNDVLELDDQTLIPGRTRHAAFHQSMHGKLQSFGERP